MQPPVYNPNWDEETKALYVHDMREIWDNSIALQVWNQYHNQLDMYIDLVSQKGDKLKILDIGCAQATLALMLAEKGHEVLAVDIRSNFIDYAKSRYTHGNIDFIVGNALEMELKQDFDIVFANQIIEHLIYPNQLVERLVQFLKNGGHLIATTPNYFYIKNNLPSFSELGNVEDYEHLQFTADSDGHFFAYRNDELIKIFEEEGLKVTSSRYFESPLISGHMKLRYLHKYISYPILKLIDGFILRTPWLGRILAHQQLIIGQKNYERFSDA
ncbi:class I SAM-dependent methyltransferase [Pseudanabaena mucicola]|uniref:Methyltransferase domain-containing protein n=1 Tax=Pseudanabaena mucicola FACHB-723 TaxID=2692860 RepID=A0ABR7ZTH8_9CYAN|nr:class I SAM-dependent methyltransferase [Pseudanabaena mucicola]MBD2187087.1 methyltransferase domain-containing protein [Pseudanabaena mucicola FACHB-723]